MVLSHIGCHDRRAKGQTMSDKNKINPMLAARLIPGMSMREWYAGQVLAGFCANPAIFSANGVTGWKLVNSSESDLVEYAIYLADIIAARKATP